MQITRFRQTSTGIALLAIVFTTVYALLSGVDANWDLRNYHYWAVYAMLNGTTFLDIAPAQIQSWTNPIVLVPAYIMIKSWSPMFATAGLGALAGLNAVLILFLSLAITRSGSLQWRLWISLSAVICALSGPIFLSQVGTTFSDVFCSIFVLAGVLALYAAGNNRFFLSGLCLGAAVGLKLTCAAYALAMGLTLLLGWRLWQLSPWRYTTFVLGGILGAVITGGYWTWYLYDHKYSNRIDCINKNDLK